MCWGAGSQVAPGGRKPATSDERDDLVTVDGTQPVAVGGEGVAGVGGGRSGHRGRRGGGGSGGEGTGVRHEGQLFRARSRPGRTSCARAEGRGDAALEGLRVPRAATHPVEVMVLTGGPERLEVAATRRGVLEAGHVPIEAEIAAAQEGPLTRRYGPPCQVPHAPLRCTGRARRRGAREPAGAPSCRSRWDQTWPAFSSAVQQVSTISRVTTYGSTLAFGRRSSM